MISALLTVVLLAAPDATPTPSPTPPPSQDRPEDLGEYDPDVDLPDVPPAPPPQRPSLPDVAIVPSLGVGMHAGSDAHERSIVGAHIWLGALIHPAPSTFGPFMGFGLSLDAVTWRDGVELENGPWYGMFETRYGVAFLDRPSRYESALFPIASIYALSGWRPERGADSGLVRLGAGLSSPAFFAFGAKEACLPLPSMVEFAIDAPDGKFSDERARSTFRAGWQF